jgi:predicted enzyme related to lactoylglutathione lyase
MGRPTHFEVHASDPARARAFYERVLGWTFQQWGDAEYWLINTGADDTPGIDGGLVPRQGEPPAPDAPVGAHVMTVLIDDLDTTIKAVTDNGGELRLPRMPVQGVGWLAYFADTEGNLFGALEADDTAS